jgi:hypothetical protein
VIYIGSLIVHFLTIHYPEQPRRERHLARLLKIHRDLLYLQLANQYLLHHPVFRFLLRFRLGSQVHYRSCGTASRAGQSRVISTIMQVSPLHYG